MTIQFRATLVQFSNGSQQTTAASLNPAWANITDRPGNDSSSGANDAWRVYGATALTTNVPFNIAVSLPMVMKQNLD